MSRINTNVTALISSRVLNTNNQNLNSSLEKLSTGLRINKGADDPAGLIASENLRKQIAGTEAAIKNGERAINVIGTAEGALSEVSDMLTELQSLLGEVANTGGMSDEEIEANQLQVDSILNSIDRIANNTEFQGIKLLNGNKDYLKTGVDSNDFDNLKINSSKLLNVSTNKIDLRAMQVSVVVVQSAQRAEISTTGGTEGFTGAPLTNKTTVQIGSNRGTAELTFASGTTQGEIMSAINEVKDITGVIASGPANLYSLDFGKDAFVSLEVISGDAAGEVFDAVDYGRDVTVNVNDMAITGTGKTVKMRNSLLDLEFKLSDAQAQATGAGNATAFQVTGGGADFALGARVDAAGLETIGIPNISTSKLGTQERTLNVASTDYVSGGTLNSLKSGGTNELKSNNLRNAQTIVDQAVSDITTLRGRLGAFQKNTLETTIRSMSVTNENLSAADSAIRDTDFAKETSNLTRSQILVQASTNVLSQANRSPQNVLALLG